jgi:hypothetical protein
VGEDLPILEAISNKKVSAQGLEIDRICPELPSIFALEP